MTDSDTRYAAAATQSPEQTSAGAADQVLDALTRLKIDPRTLLRLPWDSLHDLLGYLWPEQFWVVAAATGNGKSTFLMQLINAWASQKRRIYFLPLEQPADVMRQYWAALANDLDPARVLQNDWASLPRDAQHRVTEHLKWQAELSGGRTRVHFSDARYVSEDILAEEMLHALAFGADVVIIDHIHRLDLGTGNSWNGLVRICQAIKEGAKNCRIPVLAAAQMHRDKEGDVLAPFLPPKPTAIQGGEVIRQEADVALGLYRPLLASFTPDDARDIRAGKAKVGPFLEPHCVGAHVLKHRVRGSTFGDIVKLKYLHGKITCSETEDRLAYEGRLDL